MQSFELIVIERPSRRILTRLPVAQRAWGTFGRGELFRFEDHYYPVDQLINEFTTHGDTTLCRTIVLVGPMLPEAAMSDITIADAPSPESHPPARTRDRRSWWNR